MSTNERFDCNSFYQVEGLVELAYEFETEKKKHDETSMDDYARQAQKKIDTSARVKNGTEELHEALLKVVIMYIIMSGCS